MESIFNTFIIFLSGFVGYYLLKVARKPSVVTSNDRLRSFLLETCPILHETFWPTFWAFGTHLQTAIRHYLQHHQGHDFERQLVKMPDGGLVAFDWLNPPGFEAKDDEAKAQVPIVVFLPGLTADSSETYVGHFVDEICAQGFRAAVFIQRGNGNLPLLTSRIYSAASWEDIHWALKELVDCNPESPVYGCGVSLGGILWYNYLARQTPSTVLIRACVTISMPWDLNHCAWSLERPFNLQAFNRPLAHALLKKFKRHKPVFDQDENAAATYDFEKLFKADRVRRVDEAFICPMFGFSSASEYYEAVSPVKHFRSLSCPVVSVNACDDVFAMEESIPINEIAVLSDGSAKCDDKVTSTTPLVLILTAKGGHIGFAEGFWPSGKSWADRLAGQLLTSMHSYFSETKSE